MTDESEGELRIVLALGGLDEVHHRLTHAADLPAVSAASNTWIGTYIIRKGLDRLQVRRVHVLDEFVHGVELVVRWRVVEGR